MATAIPSPPSSPTPYSFKPLPPLPLSGAETKVHELAKGFHAGAETARAILNSVCPDPVRPLLSGLVGILDFLAVNYVQLVSNKKAAGELGNRCFSAAQSICYLIRTSNTGSWTVDPSNRAIPDFVKLLNQIIEYLNERLAPPTKKNLSLFTAVLHAPKIKEELAGFSKQLSEQMQAINFAVTASTNGSVSEMKTDTEKYDNILLDISKQTKEEVLQAIKSGRTSIDETAKLTDAVSDNVRHKIADVVLAVREKRSLIRQETQLDNVSLEESDLKEIDEEVNTVVGAAESQFNLQLQQWMISSRDVKFIEQDLYRLGRGVSSVVYKGKLAGRGLVAVKVFKFDDVTPDQIEINIVKEVRAWQDVSDHPNILTLFGVSTNNKYLLVSELCESTARKHLGGLRKRKEDWCRAIVSILGDTANALRYIHEQNIVHRDVKGNNILIRSDGSAALGDFGLARRIGSLSSTTTTQSKGTLNWCSPEQLSGPLSQLTAKTDTWSFGMTIFELLKDENPYGDYLDAKPFIVADSPTLPTAADVPTELSFLVHLAMNCCKKHPADRISDDEITACFPASTRTVNNQDKFSAWKQKAVVGNAGAQNRLGDMYYYRRDVEQDHKQAVEGCRRSALQGNALGQYNLGLMYEKGLGVEQDHKQAVEWYRKSALQGNAAGQRNLGFMYHTGLGVEQDHKQAVKWYQRSALQGNARGQYNLGLMYKNGLGVEQDHKQAVKWYQRSALQGNATAQNNLGTMFRDGLGVQQDHKQAVEWFRKSALQGNALGQCNLGLMYETGLGVEQDHKLAVEWYRKSALQGNADGQSNLGFMYHTGLGVEQDHKQAVEWYWKSALQGNAGGQRNLGFMHHTGLGVEQDDKQAVEWYRKSALQGNADAQCNLGLMYEKGLGVEQDHKQAVEWFRKSVAQGNQYAQSRLERMTKKK